MTSTESSHEFGPTTGGGQTIQAEQQSGQVPASISAQPDPSAQDSSNTATPRPRSPRKRPRSNEQDVRVVDGPLKPSVLSAPGKQPFVPPQSIYSLNITGAAELAEQKRRKLEEQQQSSSVGSGLQQTSPNNSRAALNQLQGGSGPPMTPASNLTSSNPMSLAQSQPQSRAQPLQQSESSTSTPMQVDNPAPVSSQTGFENIDSSLLPQSSSAQQSYPPAPPPPQTPAQTDLTQSNTPISSVYPDPNLQNANTPTTDLRRHASLPNPAIRRRISNIKDSPGSPTTGEPSTSIAHSASVNTPRKHSCQYCGQEFTRQHNLKSHLLTHSQERPYGCDICDAKFRRLHDLKRHTKLHTGEKPHICPKCKRRFARGDALARHTRGPGGCPGRRSSLGGDADMDGTMDDADSGEQDGEQQEDADEEMMNGIVFTGGETQEPEGMHDERREVPGIRHTAASGDSYRSEGPYPRMAGLSGSTYPPIARAPAPYINSTSGFPPYSQSSNATPTTSSAKNQPPAHPTLTGQLPPPNTFPHQNQNQSQSSMMNILSAPSPMKITESPKPLSPLNGPGNTPTPTASAHGTGGGMLAPSSARSPSLNSVFKNITFEPGRAHSKSSPGPPPTAFIPPQNQPQANTLPSLRSVPGPSPGTGTLSSNPSVSSISTAASGSYMGPPSISSSTSNVNMGVYGHTQVEKALVKEVEELRRELDELRRENELLRREREVWIAGGSAGGVREG